MRSRILFAAVVLSAAGAAFAQLRPNLLNQRNGGAAARNGAPAAEAQPQMSRDDLKNVPRGTIKALRVVEAPPKRDR